MIITPLKAPNVALALSRTGTAAEESPDLVPPHGDAEAFAPSFHLKSEHASDSWSPLEGTYPRPLGAAGVFSTVFERAPDGQVRATTYDGGRMRTAVIHEASERTGGFRGLNTTDTRVRLSLEGSEPSEPIELYVTPDRVTQETLTPLTYGTGLADVRVDSISLDRHPETASKADQQVAANIAMSYVQALPKIDAAFRGEGSSSDPSALGHWQSGEHLGTVQQGSKVYHTRPMGFRLPDGSAYLVVKKAGSRDEQLYPNGLGGHHAMGLDIKLFPDGGAEIVEPGWTSGPAESRAPNMVRINAAGDVLSGKPRALARYPGAVKLLKEALGASDKP